VSERPSSNASVMGWPQVCPKGLNPGKAIAKVKQSIHSGHVH